MVTLIVAPPDRKYPDPFRDYPCLRSARRGGSAPLRLYLVVLPQEVTSPGGGSFERLTERFDDVFRQLRGHGRISEKALDQSLREIRRALLEADVNFKVARSFLGRVRERALGREVLRSLSPGQQVIKVVHEELVALLGGTAAPLELAPQPPTAVLLVGLQGCGKTTVAAKLARHFKERGRLPYLVAADTYRPAAVEQLRTLGASIDVGVFGPSEAAAWSRPASTTAASSSSTPPAASASTRR